MTFDPILFPLSVDRCGGSLAFSTKVLNLGGGGEKRIAEWQDSLITFDAGLGVRSLSDLRTLARFHRSRKGAARAFLCRDLLDFEVALDGVEGRFATGDGTTTVFQLSKTYADDFNVDVRPITKPDQVALYVDGALQTGGYHVNYSNGKVIFDAAPSAGAVLEWTGTFFVPVRFASDELRVDEFIARLQLDVETDEYLVADGSGDLPQITLVETRGVESYFDARDFPNLLAWYAPRKESFADGASVAALQDFSGNGRGLVQATSGYRPLYRAAKLLGNPTLEFDLTDDFLGGSATLPALARFAATIVFRLDAATNYLLDFTFLRFYHSGSSLNTVNVVGGATTGLSTPCALYAPHIATLHYDGARLRLRLDGIEVASLAATGSTAATSSYTCGFGGAQISEIALYGALNPAEVARMEATLAAQHGIKLT